MELCYSFSSIFIFLSGLDHDYLAQCAKEGQITASSRPSTAVLTERIKSALPVEKEPVKDGASVSLQSDKPEVLSISSQSLEKEGAKKDIATDVQSKGPSWEEAKKKVAEIILSNGITALLKALLIIFLATNIEKDLAELLRPWLSKAYFVPEEGKSNIEEHIEMVPLFTALIQENIM